MHTKTYPAPALFSQGVLVLSLGLPDLALLRRAAMAEPVEWTMTAGVYVWRPAAATPQPVRPSLQGQCYNNDRQTSAPRAVSTCKWCDLLPACWLLHGGPPTLHASGATCETNRRTKQSMPVSTGQRPALIQRLHWALVFIFTSLSLISVSC